jgi:hypothetical protein
MHSWRVLLLPYHGQTAVYNAYNFEEPWDGPHNRRLLSVTPAVFSNPFRSSEVMDDGTTRFLGLEGSEAAFDGPKTTRFEQVTDGLSHTMAVVQVPRSRAVPWTSPQDLPAGAMIDIIRGQSAGILRNRGVPCLFWDGSVRQFAKETDVGLLNAVRTMAGGEVVDVPGL